MLYKGYFHGLEHHLNYQYSVSLITQNDDSETTNIKLAYRSPVIITTDSEGLFAPIKSCGCTITIVTDEMIPDLYSPENQGVFVEVKNDSLNEILFQGFLSPCAYSQPYAKSLDTLEIEAVSCLSTLQNIPYDKVSNTKTIKTVQAILYDIFQQTGYTGYFYHMRDSLSQTMEGESLRDYKLQESNFFDDNGEAWTCYEVLEQICLFFGWSAVPFGDSVYLIDYETISKDNNYDKWIKLSYPTGYEYITGTNNLVTITKDDYAGSDTVISLDEIYNKISLNDSIYELDEISTDIFDTDNRQLINNAAETLGGSRFIHTHKGHEDKAWTIYWTTYSFTENSNWKQHFYSVDTFQEVSTYKNGVENPSYGVNEGVNVWSNTISAQPERYWIFDDYAALTSNVDAKEVIAFNEITFKKADSFNSANDIMTHLSGVYDCRVLEYEFPEELQWNALDGSSFICFKGDLWYQCNHDRTEVWDDDFFVIYPFDGISTMAGEYDRYTRHPNSSLYNKGWSMLKARLQIGDKYWNGSAWTTQDSDFEIYYHKEMMALNSDEDEKLTYGAWQHPVYNTVVSSNSVYFGEFDKTKLIGEDCLAIPINESLSGKLKFTLYPPRQAYTISVWAEYDTTQLCPVVYMKDFELSYKFVPNNYNFVNIDEYDTDSDIIYTNIINENYVTDFDEIELKINTAAENKPISRSYIMNTSNNYIVNLTKNGVTKRQEHNLVNMYYDHYNTKKKIYECTIHDFLNPGSPVETTATEGFFCIDTQSYDVKLNHNTVKLIEY